AMGAGLTLTRIIEPLRNVRLVLFALVANFVLMPAGAVALAKALRLDEPFGVGLLLLGCAAGAPFLPKLAELAMGNLAFAVGIMDYSCKHRQGSTGLRDIRDSGRSSVHRIWGGVWLAAWRT